MKKRILITAVILAAAGLALFVYSLIASGFDFSNLGNTKYETNTYDVNEKFHSVKIDTKETNIVFKLSSDGKTRVVCEEREKTSHSVSVENETLMIGINDEREWYEFLSFFRKSLSMTVYLPTNEYEALTIDSGTGDVLIPGDFSFDSIDVKASTGDVNCKACASGNIKLKTSTGDIKAEGIDAESIDISVSTGSININSVVCKGALSAKVSTGRTVMTDVTCKSFITNGSTGDVTLKDVNASDNFNIERSTGDVRFDGCDAGEIFIKTSTGDVGGTLRSEKVFITKTSVGDINVPDTVKGGRCEITTATGDVTITRSEN